MKTTIDLPHALPTEAQDLARLEGTTLSAAAQEGLRKVIAEKKSEKEPFKLRHVSFGGDGLTEEFRSASWEQIRDAIHEGRG